MIFNKFNNYFDSIDYSSILTFDNSAKSAIPKGFRDFIFVIEFFSPMILIMWCLLATLSWRWNWSGFWAWAGALRARSRWWRGRWRLWKWRSRRVLVVPTLFSNMTGLLTICTRFIFPFLGKNVLISAAVSGIAVFVPTHI